MAYLTLTDEELVQLDGYIVMPDTQKAIDSALARLAANEDYPHLVPKLAGLLADVIAEAETKGQLVYQHRRIYRCDLCGDHAGYVKLKSGPRKGQDNLKKPRAFNGREFKRSYVHFVGSVLLGGCSTCVDMVLPDIIRALHPVKAELPEELRDKDSDVYKVFGNRRCKDCGWEGHEGEVLPKAGLMGDGTYPGECPKCHKSKGMFLGLQFDILDGHVVMDVRDVPEPMSRAEQMRQRAIEDRPA